MRSEYFLWLNYTMVWGSFVVGLWVGFSGDYGAEIAGKCPSGRICASRGADRGVFSQNTVGKVDGNSFSLAIKFCSRWIVSLIFEAISPKLH